MRSFDCCEVFQLWVRYTSVQFSTYFELIQDRGTRCETLSRWPYLDVEPALTESTREPSVTTRRLSLAKRASGANIHNLYLHDYSPDKPDPVLEFTVLLRLIYRNTQQPYRSMANTNTAHFVYKFLVGRNISTVRTARIVFWFRCTLWIRTRRAQQTFSMKPWTVALWLNL